MSFDVSRTDVDEVGAWILSYASLVSEQLSQVSSAAKGVAGLESFKGAAADNVKAYWGEIHVAAVVSLAAALGEVATRYVAYMQGFDAIDPDKNARFNEEALATAYAHLSGARTDLDGKAASLARTTESVADLIGGWTPSPASLDGALLDLAAKAQDIRFKVEAHEANHLGGAQAADGLISCARSLVASLGSGGTGASYTPGSIARASWAAPLMAALDASQAYQERNAPLVKAGCEALQTRMQERYDEEVARLARERAEQGAFQVGMAVLTVVVGALAIVATGGAATPIVVGLFVVSGAFHASNMVEGVQNIYLGLQGDITTQAFNPLRDTVFLGNQGAYDAATFIATTASSFAMPAAAFAGAVRASGTGIAKGALQGAKTLGVEFAKDIAVDHALTIAVDPLIGRVFGDGAAGRLLTEAVHQGAGMPGSSGPRRAFGAGPAKNFLTGNLTPKDAGVRLGQAGELDAPDALSVKRAADMPPPPVRPGSLGDIDIDALDVPAPQRQAMKEILEDPSLLTDNRCKGNFGEMATDAYYVAQGYERISDDVVISLEQAGHAGIDGIYFKKDGQPPYIIAEAKYQGTGSANPSRELLSDDTRQMNDKWIKNRASDALGENNEHLDTVLKLLDDGSDQVGRRLVQVDKNLDLHEFELDADARKTGRL